MVSILLNRFSTCFFCVFCNTVRKAPYTKYQKPNATKNVKDYFWYVSFSRQNLRTKNKGRHLCRKSYFNPPLCNYDVLKQVEWLNIDSNRSLAHYQESVFHVATILAIYLHAVSPLQWDHLIQIEVNLARFFFFKKHIIHIFNWVKIIHSWIWDLRNHRGAGRHL